MGAHKTNPTAIAAKNGELPPKEKSKTSKRERDAWLEKAIEDRTGITKLREMGLIRSYY